MKNSKRKLEILKGVAKGLHKQLEKSNAPKEPWEHHIDSLEDAHDMHMKERSNYFNPDTSRKASSRTTPMAPETYEYPVGTWRKNGGLGQRGHDIEQLQEFDPKDLMRTEAEGRDDDAHRYAEWARQGKPIPPIDVVQTQEGRFSIVNGHRRHQAAQEAGQKIRAWVSPTMPVPGMFTPNGKPIMTGLTWEGAVAQAHQSGKPVPKEHLDLARQNAPELFEE